jgi:hypothetical protein
MVQVGAGEAAAALAAAAAVQVLPDNPYPFNVALLLGVLGRAGAREAFDALLLQAATQADPDNPADVGWLLEKLDRAGVRDRETAAALLAREPAAQVHLDSPEASNG